MVLEVGPLEVELVGGAQERLDLAKAELQKATEVLALTEALKEAHEALEEARKERDEAEQAWKKDRLDPSKKQKALERVEAAMRLIWPAVGARDTAETKLKAATGAAPAAEDAAALEAAVKKAQEAVESAKKEVEDAAPKAAPADAPGGPVGGGAGGGGA